jgi:hypothetical protein
LDTKKKATIIIIMSDFHHSPRDNGILPPALRILCLHDAASNSNQLSEELEVLGERLYENHGIDLVYVNSPLLLREEEKEDESSSSSPKLKKNHNSPKRVWWEEQEPSPQQQQQQQQQQDIIIDGQPTTQQQQPSDKNNQKVFVGLDASLLLLRQVWTSMPFWGILAVGQGAAVASFLPLMPVEPMPEFAIFVHGESLLKDESERLMDDFTCLHIVDDSSNPSPSSERLMQQFGGEVHQQGSKNFTKSTLNAIGKVRTGRQTWTPLHDYYLGHIWTPFLFA